MNILSINEIKSIDIDKSFKLFRLIEKIINSEYNQVDSDVSKIIFVLKILPPKIYSDFPKMELDEKKYVKRSKKIVFNIVYKKYGSIKGMNQSVFDDSIYACFLECIEFIERFKFEKFNIILFRQIAEQAYYQYKNGINFYL